MRKRIAGWKRELEWAHGRITGLFARTEPRESSLAYVRGLLSNCERQVLQVETDSCRIVTDAPALALEVGQDPSSLPLLDGLDLKLGSEVQWNGKPA